MRAAKIPADLRPLFRGRHWTGQLRPGGVITAGGGMAAGACGHSRWFRWQIWLHRHPGDRPVPADMRAALRGDAPVPAWFTGRTDRPAGS
jgi:hypothetical protein